MMMHHTSDQSADPRRCDCADYLRQAAPDEATGSRDFGRGFLHAARLLTLRPAPAGA